MTETMDSWEVYEQVSEADFRFGGKARFISVGGLNLDLEYDYKKPNWRPGTQKSYTFEEFVKEFPPDTYYPCTGWGLVGGDEIRFVDIDGAENLKKWEENGFEIFKRTPSGGGHAALVGAKEELDKVVRGLKELKIGVDVVRGVNGMIVGSGSWHPSGVRYPAIMNGAISAAYLLGMGIGLEKIEIDKGALAERFSPDEIRDRYEHLMRMDPAKIGREPWIEIGYELIMGMGLEEAMPVLIKMEELWSLRNGRAARGEKYVRHTFSSPARGTVRKKIFHYAGQEELKGEDKEWRGWLAGKIGSLPMPVVDIGTLHRVESVEDLHGIDDAEVMARAILENRFVVVSSPDETAKDAYRWDDTLGRYTMMSTGQAVRSVAELEGGMDRKEATKTWNAAKKNLHRWAAMETPWDKVPGIVPMPGGRVLDIAARKTRAVERLDFCLHTTGVEIKEGDYPEIRKYLDAVAVVDPLIPLLMMKVVQLGLVGAKFVGNKTFFIFHGPTNSGKSTFGELMKGIFGDLQGNLGANIFSTKASEDEFRRDALEGVGRRVLVAGDVSENVTLSDRFKSFTAGTKGEKVVARSLGMNYIHYVPNLVPVMFSNYQMRIKDNAMRERARVAEMTRSILETLGIDAEEGVRRREKMMDERELGGFAWDCLYSSLPMELFEEFKIAEEDIEEEGINTKEYKTVKLWVEGRLGEIGGNTYTSDVVMYEDFQKYDTIGVNKTEWARLISKVDKRLNRAEKGDIIWGQKAVGNGRVRNPNTRELCKPRRCILLPG